MKKLNKGFTLIELMIVVAIIAILAAVAAPKFGQQIKKAKDAKAVALVGTWRSSAQLYYSEFEDYALNYSQLATQVDASTLKATFIDSSLTNVVGTTSASAVMVAYIQAGTATTSGGAANVISATYTTDGSIVIAGGTDTATKEWSDK